MLLHSVSSASSAELLTYNCFEAVLLHALTSGLTLQELAVSAKDVASGGALPTVCDRARSRTHRQQVNSRGSRAQWPDPGGGGA